MASGFVVAIIYHKLSVQHILDKEGGRMNNTFNIILGEVLKIIIIGGAIFIGILYLIKYLREQGILKPKNKRGGRDGL